MYSYQLITGLGIIGIPTCISIRTFPVNRIIYMHYHINFIYLYVHIYYVLIKTFKL